MAALEIKLIETELGFLLQIIKQDYRRKEFYEYDDKFTATNGFILESVTYPEVSPPRTFHLRGSDALKDSKILHTTDKEYIKRLKQAVREYNEAMEDKTTFEDCKIEIIK